MSRLRMVPLAFLLLLSLTVLPAASAQFTSNSLTLRVYADGSAAITQAISANSSAVSIDVKLLTPVLSDVIATDQSGSPLSFQISGSDITIYTLGSTGINLQYVTDALTDKQGTVWTLNFTASYATTVILPVGSTVTSVSGTPNSFSQQNGSPTLAVSPGSWQVSYGVPISLATSSSSSASSSSATSTHSTSSTGSTTQASASSSTSVSTSGKFPYTYLAAAVLIVIAALAVVFFLRRRSSQDDFEGKDLRPDDIKVLNFITAKGGKVFEPDIRTNLALPKTTAWRQVKRLERLGYVRITKVGSQNQIEAVKNRDRTGS